MNIKIITNHHHPLANHIQGLDYDSINMDELKGSDYVIDLTLLNDDEKINWLEKLSSYKVISDTTCNWGEYINEKFSHIHGQMSTAFYSPKARAEVYLRDASVQNIVEDFLKTINLEAHLVSSPGHGFTYPRTLSTLINEAYFALEDGLATREDMDQAMSFGVNYPRGLFDWSKKVGVKPISMLLQSLYQQSGDPRYRQAPYLKLEGHS